jgi:sigma-B regulation protein RsbU (phosphoserine phosphatase)
VYQSSSRVDVGGDVYDFVALEDGRLAVCLGDVTGKGIQAAADMAMAKYAFRALARSYPEPADLLARVNEVVVEEITLGKFVTMVYAVVDPRTGVVACANAGHPPTRLLRADGSVSPIPSAGLALGVDAGQEYPEERLTAGPGSALVLYTDGVIEARDGGGGELYGEERLDTFLAANARLGAQALAEALVDDCRIFAGGDIADDCAVVVLKMAP